MNQRTIFSILSLIGICFLNHGNVFAQKDSPPEKFFSIGVIADCQYCSLPGEGIRKYAASVGKLQQCVDHFNTLHLEYVIHLGDFIDRDFESFGVVTPIYNQLNMPKYHVLGNHDFFVIDEHKKDVPATLGLDAKYYDFKLNDWRFVVLDGNDISFHAYPENSAKYTESAAYYNLKGNQTPKWNGAVGATSCRGSVMFYRRPPGRVRR